jgi:hypothetical protein
VTTADGVGLRFDGPHVLDADAPRSSPTIPASSVSCPNSTWKSNAQDLPLAGSKDLRACEYGTDSRRGRPHPRPWPSGPRPEACRAARFATAQTSGAYSG